MQGHRHSVTSADGTSIGLLTAGTGPGLLLVHGGMGRLERWEPLWGLLTAHWQVTAMDRRGRGSSGDAEPYLRNAPGAQDVLPIVSATMPREGEALAAADLPALAARVTAPVLLLLGEASPAWAADITHALSAALPHAALTVLPGAGHEAIDTDPGLIFRQLLRFLA